MLKIESTLRADASQPYHSPLVWLTIAVLVVAFYFIEHNTPMWDSQGLTVSGEDMAVRVTTGDSARRLAFVGLALFGALMLVTRAGWRLTLRSPLAWLLLGYLAWCVVSIVWSVNRPLTVRNVGALMLCSIAALGIARQLTIRDLCVVALVVTTVFVANSVRIELFSGAFLPFAPEYRFAGNVHPNVQAPYCATMALAAGFLASEYRRGRVLLWGLCIVGVVLLLLTKSRTVCGAYLAGMLIFGSLGASWQKKITAVAAILWLGLVFAFGGLLLGWNTEQQATDILLLGRQEQSSSLSGRVPFWVELASQVAARPLLGYGYRTFWDPQRIGDYSHMHEWTVIDSHSAYLDTLLDLGIVGAALFLAVVVTGIREAAGRYLTSRDIGSGFLLVLLISRALNGLLESAFNTPTNFISFLVVCGIVHLGFCQRSSESTYSSPLLPRLRKHSHAPFHN